MKKFGKLLKSLLWISVVFAGLISFSCKNFLSGGDLKEDLESAIEYANTPSVTVTISCNNSYGTLGQTGGTYKTGTSNLELSLEANDSYQFVRWQVYDGDGAEAGCTADDAIYIKNPESLSTTYSILKEVTGYKIQPVCKARPYVTAASPAYVSTGVSRDREIIITFDSNINSSNFRYSEEEASALEAKSCTLLKDSDSKAYGYIKNNNVYFKNLKITDNNDAALNLLIYFEAPVVSGNKVTITPKTDMNGRFQLDESGYRDICVTVQNTVNNDGIKLLKDYSWNYRAANVTDSKTSITFDCKDGDTTMGTMNYSGTQEFYLGDSFTVSFEPNSSYEFLKWSVTGDEGSNLQLAEDGTKLTVTVLGEASGITISPKCSLLKNTSFVIAVSNGDVSPNGEQTTYKEKDSFTLIYTPDEQYYFCNWKVVNTLTGDELSEEKWSKYFEFEDIKAATTNVTVINASKNLKIVDECCIRPLAYDQYPTIAAGSVSRDTKIRLTFDREISEESLYYSDAELKNLSSQGITSILYGDSENNKKAYGYTKEGEVYFKNIEIKNKNTSENYLQYYGCPYLLNSYGLDVIIPAKKSNPPPSSKEILIKIGTEYGYYSDSGDLVGCRNSNLTWAYKTTNKFDKTTPFIQTDDNNNYMVSLKGLSYGEKKTYKDLYSYAKLGLSIESDSIPANFSQSDIEKLKNYRLQSDSDNKMPLDISVTAYDNGMNLKAIKLVIEKIGDSSYNVLTDGVSYEYPLPVDITSSTEESYTGTIDPFTEYSLDEGIYKLSIKLEDDAGNSSTGEMYYYIIIDNTAPEIIEPVLQFKRNGKVNVSNLKESTDLDISSVKYTSENGTKTLSGTEITEVLDTTIDEKSEIKIVATDILGNENEKTYSFTAGIHPGMCVYTDGFVTNKKLEGKDIFGFIYKEEVVDEADLTQNKLYLVTAATYAPRCVSYEPNSKFGVHNFLDNLATFVSTPSDVSVGTYSLPTEDDYQKIYAIDNFIKSCGCLSLTENCSDIPTWRKTYKRGLNNGGIKYYDFSSDAYYLVSNKDDEGNETNYQESFDICSGFVMYTTKTNGCTTTIDYNGTEYTTKYLVSDQKAENYDYCNSNANINAKLVAEYTGE